MTAKEIHIEIDNRLQYINSNRKQSIKPEAKDMLFNKAVLSLLLSRLPSKRLVRGQKGYEDNQIIYDNLKELKRIKSLSCYIDSDESYCMYGVLPDDYLHLVRDNTKNEYNCNGITFPTATATTVSIVVLPFTDDTAGASRYTSFSIDLNTGTTTIYAYSGLTFRSADAKFHIVNSVIDSVRLNTTGYDSGAGKKLYLDCYWEYYDNLFHADSFIFVVTSEDSGATKTNMRLSYDSAVVQTKSFTTVSHNYYNYSYASTNEYYPNRLVSSTIVTDMNRDYYDKTTYLSPLSTLYRNRIKVYHNTKFIPQTLQIEYISRPTMLDINTKQTVNINHSMINEAIDLTVQYIKASIADQNYSLILNENQNQS